MDKTKIMQCHLLNEVVVEDASSIQELVIPTQFGLNHYLSGLVGGGWVVDKTKIMQYHLLTEVLVEVEDNLGNIV